jgi:dsDNA-binding SOS-regulon protein
MGNYGKARYTQFLPSTPCKPEMRDEMLELARKKGVSLAELQREAFSLFLSQNYSNAIDNSRKSTVSRKEKDHADKSVKPNHRAVPA